MDYTEVVCLVSSNTSQFQRHAAINGDIKVLLERDWVCKLQHVYREGNEAADFLVKLGATFRTSNVWDTLLLLVWATFSCLILLELCT